MRRSVHFNGSTTIDHTKIMHSGTGRISRMMMRPMSLYESNESNGKISLSKLFDDKIMAITESNHNTIEN